MFVCYTLTIYSSSFFTWLWIWCCCVGGCDVEKGLNQSQAGGCRCVLFPSQLSWRPKSLAYSMLMGTIAGRLCSFFAYENGIYKREYDIWFDHEERKKKISWYDFVLIYYGILVRTSSFSLADESHACVCGSGCYEARERNTIIRNMWEEWKEEA